MKLLEFWTGLALGFAGYHVFLARYMVKRGIVWGLEIAAARVRLWLEGLPVELQEQLQPYVKDEAEKENL